MLDEFLGKSRNGLLLKAFVGSHERPHGEFLKEYLNEFLKRCLGITVKAILGVNSELWWIFF